MSIALIIQHAMRMRRKILSSVAGPALQQFCAHYLIICTIFGKVTEDKICFLMFCWPCISIHRCNKNQVDAPFILGLFRQSTSTCFEHICSSSLGGMLYIYKNWYVLCFSVDCLLAGLIFHLNPATIVVYIQYTSWWWPTNMPETFRGWLTQ